MSSRLNIFGGYKAILGVLFLALVLYFTIGRWGDDKGTSSEAGKPLVVVTTTMLADMVGRIGGDYIDVVALMGPGVDPHLYRPIASDVQKLMQADIVFYNGLMLEGRMDDILHGLQRKEGRPVYAVGDAVPEDELIFLGKSKKHPDPHIWFDPRLWAYGIDIVVQALVSTDPEHSKYYNDQGKLLRREYNALYQWAVEYASLLPVERRTLITSHDAYNYFGRAYGFQVVGVQGVSTLSEPGLADVAKIVDFIKARKIKAIFIESSVSPATVEHIGIASGVKIGGELFSDAMGGIGEKLRGGDGAIYDVGSYAGITHYNMTTIVHGLLGSLNRAGRPVEAISGD